MKNLSAWLVYSLVVLHVRPRRGLTVPRQEPGLRQGAGTRLRYWPWMGAARSLSANMGARGLYANMEGSVQGGY